MTAHRVRNATGEDVSAVLGIERSLATAPHWSEAHYREIVNGDVSTTRCLLVVKEAGQVIGFAAGMVAMGLGEVESVAVRASEQGRGIGCVLVERVVQWSRQEHAEAVELEVRAGTTAALRVYARLGFREIGRRPGYYTRPAEDAVRMRLDLEPEASFGSGRP